MTTSEFTHLADRELQRRFDEAIGVADALRAKGDLGNAAYFDGKAAAYYGLLHGIDQTELVIGGVEEGT